MGIAPAVRNAARAPAISAAALATVPRSRWARANASDRVMESFGCWSASARQRTIMRSPGFGSRSFSSGENEMSNSEQPHATKHRDGTGTMARPTTDLLTKSMLARLDSGKEERQAP